MNDSQERIDISCKVKAIIDEALKGFFKVESRKRHSGITQNFVSAENLEKAKRFLEGWGIECDGFRYVMVVAKILETVRPKMNDKICVDAPDWFGRCEGSSSTTILYVPEKLALKMLALGHLPEPEKEEVSA